MDENETQEVYVLLADGDGTMRSQDDPFGVAVSTEEEAIKYINEGGVGYSHSYQKLTIFKDKNKAIKWAFKDAKKYLGGESK